MSIQYCFNCDNDIDTDKDVEHFDVCSSPPGKVHKKMLKQYNAGKPIEITHKEYSEYLDKECSPMLRDILNGNIEIGFRNKPVQIT